jgi:Na+/phosphate symporter
MILLWLGSLVGLLAGLSLFRSGMGRLFAPLTKNFLRLPEPSSLLGMLVITKLGAIGQGGFQKTAYGALALLNSRSFSRRYALLLLCLAGAGLWTTLVAAALAWQVNGAYLLGVSVLIYVYSWWTQKGFELFKAVFGLGLFLSQAELLLRNQSVLLSVLGESEFHFLLADGRFAAQLVWLAAAFVITLLVQFESWAVFLALGLLAAGSLSLNGAVAFVIGEMLAHVWMLAIRSRRLNQDAKKIAMAYAGVGTFGLLIGFFLAGGLRELFSWGYSFEVSQITEKSLQFLAMYLTVIAAHAVTVMVWGHFAARTQVDEVQKGEYFSTRWIRQGLIDPEILNFILTKLQQRLALLHDQQKSLNLQERAQIPPAYLADHEQEIVKLSQWLPAAERR